jgi:hypothetical protein
MSPVLPPRPNLDHLKKQARDLLNALRSGDSDARALLKQHLPEFVGRSYDGDGISLHDAQAVIARDYGFDNWARLRKAVLGAADDRGDASDGASL